jgi:hypothetical protein
MDEPAAVDELVVKHLDDLRGRDTKLPEDLAQMPSLVAPADHQALLQVSGVALTDFATVGVRLSGYARRTCSSACMARVSWWRSSSAGSVRDDYSKAAEGGLAGRLAR